MFPKGFPAAKRFPAESSQCWGIAQFGEPKWRWWWGWCTVGAATEWGRRSVSGTSHEPFRKKLVVIAYQTKMQGLCTSVWRHNRRNRCSCQADQFPIWDQVSYKPSLDGVAVSLFLAWFYLWHSGVEWPLVMDRWCDCAMLCLWSDLEWVWSGWELF